MTISFRDPSTMFGTSAESRLFAGICAVLTVFFVGFFTAGLFLGHRQFNTEIGVVTGAVPMEGSILGPDNPPGHELLVSGHAPSAATMPEVSAAAKPAGAIAPLSAAVLAGDQAAMGAGGAAPEPLSPPAIPRGSLVVQVAALLSRARAQELVNALQQKHFAAFVRTAGADQYNRVQVGPFADLAAAQAVRQQLEELGYPTILGRR
jgi:cell division septation protein DedD